MVPVHAEYIKHRSKKTWAHLQPSRKVSSIPWEWSPDHILWNSTSTRLHYMCVRVLSRDALYRKVHLNVSPSHTGEHSPTVRCLHLWESEVEIPRAESALHPVIWREWPTFPCDHLLRDPSTVTGTRLWLYWALTPYHLPHKCPFGSNPEHSTLVTIFNI